MCVYGLVVDCPVYAVVAVALYQSEGCGGQAELPPLLCSHKAIVWSPPSLCMPLWTNLLSSLSLCVFKHGLYGDLWANGSPQIQYLSKATRLYSRHILGCFCSCFHLHECVFHCSPLCLFSCVVFFPELSLGLFMAWGQGLLDGAVENGLWLCTGNRLESITGTKVG